MSMMLISGLPAAMMDPSIIVSAQPDRFHALPAGVILAGSISQAIELLSERYHKALFLDAVLPGNQSAYRAVSHTFKHYREHVGGIFILRDAASASDVQFARVCGADGVLPKDGRSILRVLQSQHAPVSTESVAGDPAWLAALIRVASQFLASEANLAVRRSLYLARQHDPGTPQAAETIRALGSYFDDEDDYLIFARQAFNAIRSNK